MQRELLRRGSKFDIELLHLTDRAGSTITREVVRHPGAVIILPILANTPSFHWPPKPTDSIVLIRTWRPTIEAWAWELPAGTLGRGEDPGHAAHRELIEETGFRSATLRPLAAFHTSPGLSDEVMRAYVATDLTDIGQRPEPDERIEVHTMPLAAALDLVGTGQLTDAKSMVCLLLATRGHPLGPPVPPPPTVS